MKRTLTDEQIRIFRHSEIHALQRERQLREEEEEGEGGSEGFGENSQAQNGNAKRKREDVEGDKGGQKESTGPATSLDYNDEQEPRKVQRPTSNAPFARRRIISYED